MRDPALDTRRPDLRGVRRTGTVRWWKSEVVGEGFRELTEGQRVSFVWNGGEGDHGRHAAADVRAEP